MGRYLFQGEDVYFSCGEDSGCMSFRDFLASPYVGDRDAHVLVVQAGHGRGGDVFSGLIRRITRAFPAGGIRTCVPYSMALRAYILGQGLVLQEQPMIVVDNIGDRYLLSAYSGHEAVETRVLLPQNAARMADEVQRTRKNLMEGTGKGNCLVLGNDAGVCDVLAAQGKERAVFFEARFPAFQVLGAIKFAIHLMPPEDVAERLRKERARGLAWAGSLALVMACSGVFYAWSGVTGERSMNRRLQAEEAGRTDLVNALTAVSQETYQARLKALPRIDFFDVYRQFMDGLPPESRMNRVAFDRVAGEKWLFTGNLVFERKHILPFLGKGIFSGVNGAAVLIGEKP
ncbi:MAG: hypothetical protein WCI27_04875, partial [Candidatus Omnitrophota bacterium]